MSVHQADRPLWRRPVLWIVPLAAVALVLMLWTIPAALTRAPRVGGADRHKAEADVRTVLVALAVAIAGFGTLAYTARTFRMEKLGRLTERFQSASQQLGHDKPAVRVAAVQALAQLADEWPEQRQTCINVICAFLRAADNEGEPVTSSYERRAGFDLLRTRLVRDLDVSTETNPRWNWPGTKTSHPLHASWRGCDLDLSGMVVDDSSLRGVAFESGQVLFEEARFRGRVDLTGIAFSGASVSFRGATFEEGAEVLFDGCLFSSGRVSFQNAVFAGGDVSFNSARFCIGGAVHFVETRLGCGGVVKFHGAKLAGAENMGPNRGGVSFAQAQFGEQDAANDAVSFDDATFIGTVLFDQAKFRRDVSFRRATLSEATLRFRGVELEADLSFAGASAVNAVLQVEDVKKPYGHIDMTKLAKGHPDVKGDYRRLVKLSTDDDVPSPILDRS